MHRPEILCTRLPLDPAPKMNLLLKAHSLRDGSASGSNQCVCVCSLVLYTILFQIIARCDFRGDLCFFVEILRAHIYCKCIKTNSGRIHIYFFRWRDSCKKGHEVEKSVFLRAAAALEGKNAAVCPAASC